jgi:hypothetical protein
VSERGRRIVARYIADMGNTLSEIHRVLRPGGEATLVVADATIEGSAVSISTIAREVAATQELELREHTQRAIPTASRYLPPPTLGGSNTLDKRMRVEHCLTFAKSLLIQPSSPCALRTTRPVRG